jgi:hypothetical protein
MISVINVIKITAVIDENRKMVKLGSLVFAKWSFQLINAVKWYGVIASHFHPSLIFADKARNLSEWIPL